MVCEMPVAYGKDNVFYLPENCRWDYIMERAKQDLADVGDLETDSRMEGNTLLYIYGPKRGATKNAPQKPATEPKAAGEAKQQTEEVNNA